MHDCHGKPLNMFDRVRAATKEELEVNGHKDLPDPFDGEKTIVSLNPATDSCNVIAVGAVAAPVLLVSQDCQAGMVMVPFSGGQAWLTTRRLVKVG